MKKMIIILYFISSFFINVCIVNAITTINLDYNGGFGVYPNDITSSSHLTYATTY